MRIAGAVPIRSDVCLQVMLVLVWFAGLPGRRDPMMLLLDAYINKRSALNPELVKAARIKPC